jgi:hypothetical protein
MGSVSRRYYAGLRSSQKAQIIRNNTPVSNILCLCELVNYWFPLRQCLRPTKEFIEEHTLKHVTNKRRCEYFGGPSYDQHIAANSSACVRIASLIYVFTEQLGGQLQ